MGRGPGSNTSSRIEVGPATAAEVRDGANDRLKRDGGSEPKTETARTITITLKLYIWIGISGSDDCLLTYQNVAKDFFLSR